MAVQRRIKVAFADVFPAGAFLVGEVEAVTDFNAPARADGSRPQLLDKESGLPVWSVPVLDADPQASKRDKTLTVKVSAAHQPVPPENKTPFPFRPVEFVGLTATGDDFNFAGRPFNYAPRLQASLLANLAAGIEVAKVMPSFRPR